MVQFQRKQKLKSLIFKNDLRPGTSRANIPIAMNSGNTRGSFASILKEGSPKQSLTDQLKHVLVSDDPCIKERDFSMSQMGKVQEGDLAVWEESGENSLSCKHLCLKTKIDEIINESFKIILKGKVHWIHAKWVPKFLSENDDSSSNDELTDFDEGFNFEDKEHKNPNDDSDVDKDSESSCMQANDFVHEIASNIPSKETPQTDEPFNIYELLQKKNVNISLSRDSEPVFPLGSTPTTKITTKAKIQILSMISEVRMEQERFGSSFNIHGANAFNNFISMAGLMVLFPQLSGLCLDRHLSDHRSIIMYESSLDYGTTLFRMFHSWSKMEGFDKFVEDLWHSMVIADSNGLIRMKKKL
ncbi:hypothetical protein Tco_0038970 [Tanacetum coccineum]